MVTIIKSLQRRFQPQGIDGPIEGIFLQERIGEPFVKTTLHNVFTLLIADTVFHIPSFRRLLHCHCGVEVHRDKVRQSPFHQRLILRPKVNREPVLVQIILKDRVVTTEAGKISPVPDTVEVQRCLVVFWSTSRRIDQRNIRHRSDFAIWNDFMTRFEGIFFSDHQVMKLLVFF